jgi:hypothetical protein
MTRPAAPRTADVCQCPLPHSHAALPSPEPSHPIGCKCLDGTYCAEQAFGPDDPRPPLAPPSPEPSTTTTFWRAEDEAALGRIWGRPHTDIETVSGRAIFDKAMAGPTQELTITAQALRLAIPAIEIEAETRVIRALRAAPGLQEMLRRGGEVDADQLSGWIAERNAVREALLDLRLWVEMLRTVRSTDRQAALERIIAEIDRRAALAETPGE